MNEAYGLSAENILSTLPDVLAQDESMRALGSSIAQVLSSRRKEINTLSIYPRIRELPEDLLDILSYDFKVDWWDYSYSLEEKRNTMQQSWYVHKHMGTPGSVKAALSAIYPGIILEEWWNYDGMPFHFRLKIPTDESMVDPIKHSTVMSLVRFYQNLRSVLDSVEYSGTSGTTVYYGASAAIAAEVISSATAMISDYSAAILTDENGDHLLDELNNNLVV